MKPEGARKLTHGKVTLKRGKLMGYEAENRTLVKNKNEEQASMGHDI